MAKYKYKTEHKFRPNHLDNPRPHQGGAWGWQDGALVGLPLLHHQPPHIHRVQRQVQVSIPACARYKVLSCPTRNISQQCARHKEILHSNVPDTKKYCTAMCQIQSDLDNFQAVVCQIGHLSGQRHQCFLVIKKLNWKKWSLIRVPLP